MPKVSIIVIIYKVERFLRRCLESLIAQTYEDIEIICVVGDKDAPGDEEPSIETKPPADGSAPENETAANAAAAAKKAEASEPDTAANDAAAAAKKAKASGTAMEEGNTDEPSKSVLAYYDKNRQSCLEMCREYAKRDERIRVIAKKPEGTARARNTGLDAARGKYIAFVDGDDFIEPAMISVMVDALEKEQADISIVGKYLEYENCADIVPFGGEKETGARALTRAEAYEIIFYQTGFFLHIWDKLYRRELFDGVRFDPGKKVEDRYVTYKLLSKAEKIVFSPAPQYHFRISEDSGSKVEDNLAKSFEADKLICREVMESPLSSEEYESLLRAGEYFIAYEAMSVIQNDMLYGSYSAEHDREYLDYVRAYAKSVKKNPRVGRGVKQKVTLCLRFPKVLSFLTKSRRRKFLKHHIPYKTDVDWGEIYREQGVE